MTDEIFESSVELPLARRTPLVRPSPLRPMVFGALALIAGIVLGRAIPVPAWSLIGAMSLILVFAVAGLLMRRNAPEGRAPMHTGFLLFGVILCFGWLRGDDISTEQVQARTMARILEPLELVRVEGVVASDPQRRDYGWRMVIGEARTFSDGASSSGNPFPMKLQAVVLLEEGETISDEAVAPWNKGQRLSLSGRIKLPKDASFPGDFDEELYLASHGIGAKLNVKHVHEIEILDGANWRARMHARLGEMRRAINATLDTFIGDPSRASLATALLIGERSGLSPALNEAFARTGLVHILSVSGYHTGIVLLFVLGFLRVFGLGPRATALCAIVALAAYVALTGFNPPVVRAAFMGAFMMGGWALGRHTSLLSGLAVSAFLTLMHDPRNLYRPDWQLSYLCVLSITAFAPAIYELALPMTRPAGDDSPSRLLRFVRQQIWLPFVVVLAVQIGLLPIQLHYFGQISLVGFLIQPLAVGIVIVSMALSILVCVFAWMPAAGIAFGWLANANLAVFEWMATTAGSPGWAVLELPRMPAWMIALYLVTILLGQHLLKGRAGMNQLDWHQRRSLVWRLILVLMFVAGLVWLPRPGGARGVLDLYVVDVGQGDALVLRFPNGQTALIDGGRGWTRSGAEPDIVRFLKSLGVKRLDLVVATHADADHIGGLPGVLKQFKIGRFVHGPDTSSSNLFEELGRELAIAPYPVRQIAAGDTFDDFDPVTIEALNPLPGTDNNDASVTLLVDFEDVEILLTGDIEAATEQRIIESGRARDIEVLKVAHHGSASSTTTDFLSAFQPEIALISVGRNNIYRHPSPFVIERLRERGITTARTDEMGTILLRTDGHQIRLYQFE